jgi:hypothetical protein
MSADPEGCYPDYQGVYWSESDEEPYCPYIRQCKPECDGFFAEK